MKLFKRTIFLFLIMLMFCSYVQAGNPNCSSLSVKCVENDFGLASSGVWMPKKGTVLFYGGINLFQALLYFDEHAIQSYRKAKNSWAALEIDIIFQDHDFIGVPGQIPRIDADSVAGPSGTTPLRDTITILPGDKVVRGIVVTDPSELVEGWNMFSFKLKDDIPNNTRITVDIQLSANVADRNFIREVVLNNDFDWAKFQILDWLMVHNVGFTHGGEVFKYFTMSRFPQLTYSEGEGEHWYISSADLGSGNGLCWKSRKQEELARRCSSVNFFTLINESSEPQDNSVKEKIEDEVKEVSDEEIETEVEERIEEITKDSEGTQDSTSDPNVHIDKVTVGVRYGGSVSHDDFVHKVFVHPNEGVDIEADIENKGDGEITVKIRYCWDDDKSFGFDSNNYLGRDENVDIDHGIRNNGQHENVLKHFRDVKFSSPGIYYLYVDVSVYDDEEDDLSASHNRREYGKVVVVDPNLELSLLYSGNKDVFEPGEEITLQSWTTNQSADTRRDINVSWFLSEGETHNNPTPFEEDIIHEDNIEAGEVRLENAIITLPTEPGIYTISVHTDSSEIFTEVDEEDNWQHFTLEVKNPIPFVFGSIASGSLVFDEESQTNVLGVAKTRFFIDEEINVFTEITDVTVGYRTKLECYKNDALVWQQGENDSFQTVTEEIEKVTEHWQTTFSEEGTYTFKFFVDIGEGWELQEGLTTTVEVFVPFTFSSLQTGSIINCDDTCAITELKNSFVLGEDFYAVATLNNIQVNYRTKFENYVDGSLWNTEESVEQTASVYDPQEIVTVQSSNPGVSYENLPANCTYKFFIDTGEGWELQGEASVTIQMPEVSGAVRVGESYTFDEITGEYSIQNEKTSFMMDESFIILLEVTGLTSGFYIDCMIGEDGMPPMGGPSKLLTEDDIINGKAYFIVEGFASTPGTTSYEFVTTSVGMPLDLGSVYIDIEGPGGPGGGECNCEPWDPMCDPWMNPDAIPCW